jgi:hypothetical protein
MVNTSNRIEGALVDRHPMSDGGKVELWSKSATVLAVEAPIGGVIMTRDGERRFQAGDFIVTDNPPTHAWRIGALEFKATHHKVNELPTGAIPNVPSSAIEQRAKTTAKAVTKNRKAAAHARRSPKPKVRADGKRMPVPRTKTEPGVPGVDMAATADGKSTAALGGGG